MTWKEQTSRTTGKTYWRNTETGETTWDNPYQKWIEKISRNNGKTYWRNTETGETTWDNPNLDIIPSSPGGRDDDTNDCGLKGLSWQGNSCYADSVLLALLSQDVISNSILNSTSGNVEIRDELATIRNFIMSKNDISNYNTINLKNIFAKYPHNQAYHKNGTQDTGEFIDYLESLMNFIQVAISENISIYSNEEIEVSNDDDMLDIGADREYFTKIRSIDCKASCKYFIPNDNLLGDRYNLDFTRINHMELYDRAGVKVYDKDNMVREELYYNKCDVITIVDAPYIIFDIQRLNPFDGEYNDIDVIYKEKMINRVSNEEYTLTSIILYQGGHYTLIIKCPTSNEYYYYNDIPNTFVYIGEFDQISSDETEYPNPYTQGTQYIYVKTSLL